MEIDYKNNIIKNVILSVVINCLLPFIIYKLLVNHIPSIIALMISTTIPIIDNIYHIIKNKKLDIFATFVILGFIIGIISMLFTHNQKLLLIRQSYITGIIGIIFLISIFFKKPIIYYFAERFLNSANKNNKEKSTNLSLNKKWENKHFRFMMKLITLVWGVALILEAFFNITLVFILSISKYLTISPLISYGFIGFAMFITIIYRKKSKNIFNK